MMDGIIKADGTSRLMRATLPATYEEFRAQCAAGTQPLDVLFNAIGWSQLPTFLSKGNLASDDTLALFGLGANAVPDDVFSFLGEYNKHWWSREGAVAATYRLEAEVTDAQITMSGYSGSVFYSDNITVSDSGEVSLVAPISSFSVVGRDPNNTGVELNNLNAIKGKFFYCEGTMGGSLGNNAICYRTSTTDAYFGNKGSIVSAQKVVGVAATKDGEISYVNSTDRNAYPDGGTVDGLTYQYLGVPYEKFPAAPQIATGSYTGTGTYGSGNPNSITFPFVPKFVYICAQNESAKYILLWVSGARRVPGVIDNGSDFQVVTLNGKTISWYCGYNQGAGLQLNFSGVLYQWIAIG